MNCFRFSVWWWKFYQNWIRNVFKMIFWKMVVLYEIRRTFWKLSSLLAQNCSYKCFHTSLVDKHLDKALSKFWKISHKAATPFLSRAFSVFLAQISLFALRYIRPTRFTPKIVPFTWYSNRMRSSANITIIIYAYHFWTTLFHTEIKDL